jgi:predicted MFS family arabinose efflux permease
VRVGLVAGVAVSVVVPWVESAWPAIVAVTLATIAYNVLWVPGTALLSDGAEAAGLEQGFGFALLNLAWAPANAVGAALSGALAEAIGDAAVFLLAAGLCFATLVVVHGHRSRCPTWSATGRSANDASRPWRG